MCEYLNLIFSAIAALSTLGTVIIGGAALNNWKKIRKSELAEEIIILSNELKALIEWSRSSFGFEEEGKSRKKGDYENEDKSSLYDSYYICVERLKNENYLFAKIPSLKIKSSLHFPSLKIDNNLQIFLETAREIQSASRRLMSGARGEHKEKYENKICYNYSDNDEIQNKINDAVSNIEKSLKNFCK